MKKNIQFFRRYAFVVTLFLFAISAFQMGTQKVFADTTTCNSVSYTCPAGQTYYCGDGSSNGGSNGGQIGGGAITFQGCQPNYQLTYCPLQGQSCNSSANSCNMTNSGTYTYDGNGGCACTASTPSNNSCPAQCSAQQGQYCSSNGNSCGMTNSGSIQCDGSCNASTPSDSMCVTSPTVSCSGNNVQTGNSITWTAASSGGSGGNSYSWWGSGLNSEGNGPTGNPVNSSTYNVAGTKTANVRVTDSGGRTATASCSASVSDAPPSNSQPIGYIDGAGGGACTVDGWAEDPDSSGTAIRVDLYFNGPAGQGTGYSTTAGNYRGDLCGAYGCYHGYSFSIPDWLKDGNNHSVYAYGIDTANGPNPQLGNSPTSFSCALPSKPDLTADAPPSVSGVTGQAVSLPGVIRNSGAGYAPASYSVNQICSGGCAWETDIQNIYTSALGSAQATSIGSTYTFNTVGTYYYQYCADNWSNSIAETNESNNCSGYGTITIKAPNRQPVGNLETAGTTANSCTAGGWAYDPDSPNQSIQVHLYIDGTGYAVTANGSRTDVQNAYGLPMSNYGFNFSVPDAYRDGATHTMHAYGIDTGGGTNPDLSQSPMTFSCAPQPPDITADSGSAVAVSVGSSVSLSALVRNIGAGAAGYFPNIVQICNGSCVNVNKTVAASSVNSLASNGSQSVSASYSPTSSDAGYGQLYYRICGNTNTSFVNAITESNYGNDCGGWQSLTVTIPTPSCSVSANPSSVVQGGASTLTWTSSNVSSCTGSGFSTGGAVSGSTTVTPSNGVNNYGLQCTGSYGTCNATPTAIQAGCSGTAAPSISASPKRVKTGAQTTLSWSGTGVNSSCVLTKNGSTIASTIANSCSVGTQNTLDTVTATSKYCAVCDGGTPQCVTVSVIPSFQEF